MWCFCCDRFLKGISLAAQQWELTRRVFVASGAAAGAYAVVPTTGSCAAATGSWVHICRDDPIGAKTGTENHCRSLPHSNITRINPGGAGTNWCGSAFVAKFSADLTLADLK